MIHKIDGNHPATAMLAGIGKDEVDYIKAHSTELDLLSIQMYADVIRGSNTPKSLNIQSQCSGHLCIDHGFSVFTIYNTKTPVECPHAPADAVIASLHPKACIYSYRA